MIKLFNRKIEKNDTNKNTYDNILDKNVPDLLSTCIPDGIHESYDYVYFGPNRYARSFVVTIYPRETYLGWLDELYSIGEIDISVFGTPVPEGVVSSALTLKLTKVESEYIAHKNSGNILYTPQLEEAKKALEKERHDISTNRDRMFFVSIYVTIHAKTKKDLDYKTVQIQDIFAKRNARINVMMFRQLEGLKYTLPINPRTPSDFDRNMTSGGFLTLFPISNPDLTHSSGINFAINKDTGAPMFLDIFIGPPSLNNPNMAILGIPGSGKSLALKTFLARNSLIGRRFAVLDPEGEYRKLVNDMLDGEYIDIKQGQMSGINLFEIDVDREIRDDGTVKEEVPIDDKVADLWALMGVIVRNFMGRQITALELSAIEQTVKEIYEDRGITKSPNSLYEEGRQIGNKYILGKIKKRMPTLTDFQKKLSEKKNGKELSQILYPFLRGNSLGMFDCESTLNVNVPKIGFNLRDIKDDFTKLYTSFVIMSWLEQTFMLGDANVNKIVAVDEAWMFTRYPEGAKFLETFARRGRKHRASLCIATHYIEEFLNNEEGLAVIKSCATTVLMRQHPGFVDLIVEKLGLASRARKMLSSFVPGECLISLNGRIAHVKVNPTNFEWKYVIT